MSRIRNIREEQKAGLRMAIGTGTAVMTSVGIGYVQGRYPEKSAPLGVGLGLWIGALGMAGQLLEWGGEDSYIFGGLGTGALCAWGGGWGQDVGQRAAQKAAQTATPGA